MHPLITYLLCINTFCAILGILGHSHKVSERALATLSIMGGGVGVLVTSIAFDRRTRKNNVALRFVATWSTLLWALVLAQVFGWHRFDVNRLVGSLQQDHSPLLIYLVTLNVVTFVLFCIDKFRAQRGRWRIRESVLLGCSLFGGAVGGLLGMAIAHHKVRKAYFAIGMPLALVLDIAIVAYLLQAGWA
jgi:uncharacterized membrane protein YsdA (DUF1294 family)